MPSYQRFYDRNRKNKREYYENGPFPKITTQRKYLRFEVSGKYTPLLQKKQPS